MGMFEQKSFQHCMFLWGSFNITAVRLFHVQYYESHMLRKRKRTLGVLSRQENVICVFNRNIRKQRNVLLSIISPRIY